MTGEGDRMSSAREKLSKAARDPQALGGVVAHRATAVRDALEGARDAHRLQREQGKLVPESGGVEASALRPLYDEYVASVSSPDHAVSWESAACLLHLCRVTRPRRALDLGSGFSSLVLRSYAAAAPEPVDVVSVDDSEQWLPRTREFLRDQELETGALRLWSEFAARPDGPFDLIFHDLAGGELRNSASSFAVGLLAPGGCIVFDDAHHPGHRKAARRAAGDAGLGVYSLRRWTLDGYGRFALLGVSSSSRSA